MKAFLLLLFLSLGMSKSWAAVHLFVWQPSPDHPSFLLPRHDHETPRQAVERYRALLHSEAEIRAEIGDSFGSAEGDYRELPKGRDKMLFIANDAGDHEPGSTRATRFLSQFPETQNFVLLLGAAERFQPQARQEIYRALNREFAGLVAMGGDDVAPSTYRDAVTYARGFNEARDRLEIELIQSWIRSEKGFLFGVCRGHQITSVASGYKMIQDIPIETKAPTPHADNDHVVYQRKTTHGLLEKAVGSSAPFQVYSWHHQAVKFQPGGPLEVAAVSPEGIVEALEFRNGRGLLVQFHPELKNSKESRAILRSVWSNVRSQVQTFSCKRVLSH